MLLFKISILLTLCLGILGTPLKLRAIGDIHDHLVASQLLPKDAKRPYGDAIVDYLTQVLENFRAKFKTGIPDIGVPVLDPLTLGEFDVDMHIDEYVGIDGYFDQMTVASLSDFEITEIKVNIFSLKIDLTLTFPKIELSGNYNLNGSALFGILPVFGGPGNFRVTAQNVVTSLTVQAAQTKEDGLQIETLEVDIHVDKLPVYFQNLFGGGMLQTLLDVLIGNSAVTLINQVSDRMLADFTTWIQTQLNKMLKGTAINI